MTAAVSWNRAQLAVIAGMLNCRATATHERARCCHCLDCQRRTGSAFSVPVFYRRDMIAVQRGITNSFERNAANGFSVRFHFCVRCGSSTYWEFRRMPNLVGVALGAFTDPKFAQPTQSVWTNDKHAWLVIPDDITEFESTQSHGRRIPDVSVKRPSPDACIRGAMIANAVFEATGSHVLLPLSAARAHQTIASSTQQAKRALPSGGCHF